MSDDPSNDVENYECETCKGRTSVPARGSAPECCGRPMRRVPLDKCRLSSTAEHHRLDDTSEPCDDGRSG